MSILGSLLMPQLKMGGTAAPMSGAAPGSDIAPPVPGSGQRNLGITPEEAWDRQMVLRQGSPTQAPPAPTYSPAPGAGIVNPISELNRVLGGVR